MAEVHVCDKPDCGLHDPEKAKQFYEALERGDRDGFIKVSLPGDETVWAFPLSDTQAIILNIPVITTASVSWRSVVETTSGGFMREFMVLIHQRSRRFIFRYGQAGVDAKEEIQRRWRGICSVLKPFAEINKMRYEGMFLGIGAIAYLKTISKTEILAALDSLDFDIEIEELD